MTFFMAGYDATTTLLTNALYHLATNDIHQKRVLQEMKEAVRKQGVSDSLDLLVLCILDLVDKEASNDNFFYKNSGDKVFMFLFVVISKMKLFALVWIL